MSIFDNQSGCITLIPYDCIIITVSTKYLPFFTNLSVDEIHRLAEDRRATEEANIKRRKILKWLSFDDFEETHERHFQKRFENTGQWLLDDPRFTGWRDGAKSSLLWCHGARKL